MNELLSKIVEYLNAAEGVAPEVWNSLVLWERLYGVAAIGWWILAGILVYYGRKVCAYAPELKDTNEEDFTRATGIFMFISAFAICIASAPYILTRLITPEIAALQKLITVVQ